MIDRIEYLLLKANTYFIYRTSYIAGKTHTMEGDIHSEENAGIVPRSVKAILEQLESSGAEFTIRVSFLELCKYYKINMQFIYIYIYMYMYAIHSTCTYLH